MSLLIYQDIINKYTPETPVEREPYQPVFRSDYFVRPNQKSRFIDVHEMLNSLYDEKLISYVRTSSPLLPISQFDDRFSIFDALAQSHFKNPEIMNLLTRMDIHLMKPAYWVEDCNLVHSALTPTSCPVDMMVYFNSKWRPCEEIRKNMYMDICKSYIKLFIPN